MLQAIGSTIAGFFAVVFIAGMIAGCVAAVVVGRVLAVQ